jgi:hypothetical protein
LVCLCSSIYEFWWSLWNLLAIVLSLFFDLHILVISLVSFGHCVFCLLRFKDSAISLVSVGHCVVCLLRFKSKRSPEFVNRRTQTNHWQKDTKEITRICKSKKTDSVFCLLWFKDSAISLVSVCHCVVCLLRFKVSWNIFGICCPLCCLSSSIYGFWLSVLVYVCHCVVCLLRFTYSGYLFGFCWPLCCLSSLIYIFWFFLLYFLAIVLFVFFDLHISCKSKKTDNTMANRYQRDSQHM